MTLRDNITPEKRRAHAILDRVRAGCNVPENLIAWALAALGETLE
ncbi:hypothetical protein [Undibacterium sp.]